MRLLQGDAVVVGRGTWRVDLGYGLEVVGGHSVENLILIRRGVVLRDGHERDQDLAILRWKPVDVVEQLDEREGTTSGAACLALMREERLPEVPLFLKEAVAAQVSGLDEYQSIWRTKAYGEFG